MTNVSEIIGKKAVIFARVSSREQELGQSIDAQLQNLRLYCKRQTFSVIKEYSITESSTRGDRKKFTEMLSFVKQQKMKVIIVADCIDRIQRSFRESIELSDLVHLNKIEIHFVRENLIISSESNTSDNMRWDFGVLAAKSYVSNLSDNVKRSMKYNWEHGRWQGSAPLGYKNVRSADGKADVVLDEERAPLIRQMFEEYATGLHTTNSLVDWCKEHNLTSRGDRRRPGKFLSRVGIYQILKTPFYYGMMKIKDKMYKHNHPVIIDKDLFDTVQVLLSNQYPNKNEKDLPVVPVKVSKRRYKDVLFPFTGIFKCGCCGHLMTPEIHKKPSGKEYIHYKCGHMVKTCTQKTLNQDEIIKQFYEDVADKLYLTPDEIEKIKSNIKPYLKSKNIEIATKTDVQHNISVAKERKSRLVKMLLDGLVDKSTYTTTLAEIETTILENEHLLEKYQENNVDIAESITNILKFVGNLRKIIESSKVQDRRCIFGILLSNSVIDGKKCWFSLQKMFDSLLKSNSLESWLGRTDSNHDKENQNLLSYH